MQKRKFDELISHFNRKVSDMSIDQKHKMELLGMISAIGFAHEKELGPNLAEVGRDLISRKQAIDALDRIFDRCEEIEAHLPEGDPDRTGYKMYPDWLKVWNYLRQLPSAQPEPKRGKTGRWMATEADEPCFYRCSECGRLIDERENFCPNCGVDMRGEKDG